MAGKTVLELDCGEGHLTATIFSGARNVKGSTLAPLQYPGLDATVEGAFNIQTPTMDRCSGTRFNDVTRD